MITKYGLNTFLIAAGFVVIIIIGSIFIQNAWVKYFFLILGISFLFFNVNFFRDPERKTPPIKNVVFSPADGKVVILKNTFEKRFINGEATQISIFMSPLNVHVN